MLLRLFLATVHLLALGIGFGAVWGRARSLGTRPLDLATVRRAFAADTWWGIAAFVWITTGVWRLLAATEKPTTYYMHSAAFQTKLTLFALVFALELWPMITLLRWRSALRKSGDAWRPDENAAGRMSAISYGQFALLVAIVAAAVAMARWAGASPTR